MAIKALIFDRDGTLIEHVPYLHDPAGVRLLPTVRDALALARDSGVRLYVHTNQSGVGRGMFTVADAVACNRRMIELLDLGPEPFEAICIAPEAPSEPMAYRKPSPRYAQEIMERTGLSAEELCYVGDRGSDLVTAVRAGTRGAGVVTGLDDLSAELAELGLADRFPVYHSLLEAVTELLRV